MKKTTLNIALFFIVGSLLIVAGAFFQGCTKDPLGCVKPSGKEETILRSLAYFDAVFLQNNIDVEFHFTSNPDDVRVEITGGNLLLPKIKTEIIPHALIIPGDTINPTIVDSLMRLVISNDNQCNWVRSYDKPLKAKVYYHKLKHLEYRSNGFVSFNEPLESDTFRLDVFEGGGQIELSLNTRTAYLSFHYGTADILAEGRSGVSYYYQNSYGPIRAENLESEFVYLNNNSLNHTFVHANVHLGATISSAGNVYYRGNPESIDLTTIGSGELLRLE